MYENFIDLFRFTNVNDPLIPTQFRSYAALSATEDRGTIWQWISSDVRFISGGSGGTGFQSSSSLVPLSGYNKQFINVQRMNTLTMRSTKIPEEFTLFVSTSSYLFAYQLDDNDTMFDFVLSADGIGLDDKIIFQNIQCIEGGEGRGGGV